MNTTDTPKPDAKITGYVVWLHSGTMIAVAQFSDRNMADEYAAYCNRRDPAQWYEVRRNWGFS